jgi:hypothetical protein
MKIKPTRSYEGMWSYYTLDTLSFVRVSATYCGHFMEVFFKSYIIKNIRINLKHN